METMIMMAIFQPQSVHNAHHISGDFVKGAHKRGSAVEREQGRLVRVAVCLDCGGKTSNF